MERRIVNLYIVMLHIYFLGRNLTENHLFDTRLRLLCS